MKPADEIERLVKRMSFRASPEMDELLRASILQADNLGRQGESAPDRTSIRRRIMKISTTRIIVAALIGTGVVAAAAVGVRYKYHFLKKDERGRHVVVTEDGRRSWVFSKKTAGNPQQAVETAEEMDLLIQQGKKELVSVHDTEVGGRLDNRKLLYRYTLSDGRTVDQVEDDPATGPGTLTKEQKEEARRLWENVLAGSSGYLTDRISRSQPKAKRSPPMSGSSRGEPLPFRRSLSLSPTAPRSPGPSAFSLRIAPTLRQCVMAMRRIRGVPERTCASGYRCAGRTRGNWSGSTN
jgi:hypothetical protein